MQKPSVSMRKVTIIVTDSVDLDSKLTFSNFYRPRYEHANNLTLLIDYFQLLCNSMNSPEVLPLMCGDYNIDILKYFGMVAVINLF